jgi:hypothetical protein
VRKSSAVLKAFTIIGPEEILKLSEASHTGHGKMVSGDSFVHWEEEPSHDEDKGPAKEADVIPFPQKKHQFTAMEEPLPADAKAEHIPSFINTDLALMQREMARDAEEALTRMSAKKGYKSATEMFVIKTKDVEGKSKMRFASTHGVLVDKKQA